jgi:hypothetical protein
MTSKKVIQTRGRKKYLAAAIPLILAAQANAVEFNFGDVEMSLDSQLTLGSSWRMEDRDPALTQGITGSDTFAQNDNDGDNNFDKGDAFSQVFKGTHDFQISYNNFGAFVRGKYWYDAALEDGNKANFDDGARISSAPTTRIDKSDGTAFNDDGASEYAKFSGAQILDAFVYGEFELGEMPLDVRLGKQVLSWGESTFIQGGINQTNPFDVSALRRPGAELKEGLIPVNMAFASLGVTENLSAELFYQLEHQETVIPHCGTYFSDNDYAAEGCGPVETAAGNITRDPAFEDGIKRPSDDGQFGVAFRYFSEALDTEFGFFAMNVHSRVPLISGTKAVFDEQTILTNQAVIEIDPTTAGTGPNGFLTVADQINGLSALLQSPAGGGLSATDAAGQATVSVLAGLTTNAASFGGTTPYYYVDFPEDQQLAGVSFATNIAGVAVSGELTHKLDVPVQINTTQLVGAVLQADAIYNATFLGAYSGLIAGAVDPSNPTAGEQAAAASAATTLATAGTVAQLGDFGMEVVLTPDGESAAGYKTFDVTQAQVTAIKLFDQVLGANRYALVAEAGYTYVHGLDENSSIKFKGTCNTAGTECTNTVTEGSWGYRLRVSGDYSDVFAGINLSPVLSFAHDVEGRAPDPGGNFIEDRQTIGLALNAEYANMYTAGLSYTMYEGGGDINGLDDRDYAALTLGVQF